MPFGSRCRKASPLYQMFLGRWTRVILNDHGSKIQKGHKSLDTTSSTVEEICEKLGLLVLRTCKCLHSDSNRKQEGPARSSHLANLVSSRRTSGCYRAHPHWYLSPGRKTAKCGRELSIPPPGAATVGEQRCLARHLHPLPGDLVRL